VDTLSAKLQVAAHQQEVCTAAGINVVVFCGESAPLNQNGLLLFEVNSAKTPKLYERL
jgi:hypothetical protein